MSTPKKPVVPSNEAGYGTGVRVRTHPALCSGWGNCHRFGGGVYPLDEDGKIAVHLLDVPAEHALDAWRGASVCPEHAISVIGEPEAYWLTQRSAPASSPEADPAALASSEGDRQ